jgi:hypothetical protein
LIDSQLKGKLQKQSNGWQGKVKTSRGTHTLKIAFKCTHNAFGTFILASGMKTINASKNDKLSILSHEYQYPDDDGDGRSNLAELEAGTDPANNLDGATLKDFRWANPLPQGNTLFDVIWTGDEFLAVGSRGTLLTSGNGQSWSAKAIHNTKSLRAIAWSGSQFVAVGDSGTLLTRAGSSQDWIIKDPGTNKNLFAITWTGNQFVAIGQEVAITSADGIDWVTHHLPQDSVFRSITWTGEILLAVGSNPNKNTGKTEGAIITSTNGIHWSPIQLTKTAMLWDIEWTGSQLIAVGGDQFLSGSFLSGSSQGQTGVILTSLDGENWQQQTSNSDVDLHTISYDTTSETIIAAGGNSNSTNPAIPNHGILLTSRDAIHWAIQDSQTNGVYRGLASSSTETVAVGEAGVIKSSKNLQQWHNHSSGTRNNLNDLVSMSNQLVAVGANGEVLTSQDGRSWASRNSGTTTDLTAVTWTGSVLVAVGGKQSPTEDGLSQVGTNGIILTSSDGISWIDQTPGSPLGLIRDVAWTGSQLVAVGSSGLVITSPDGIQWTTQDSGTTHWLNAVTSNDEQIIIAGGDHFNKGGSGGVLLTSSSGSLWNNVPNLNKKIDLMSIAWTGEYFIATGGIPKTYAADTSQILTSYDGIDWITSDPGINSIIQDIHWSGSKLQAVSTTNSILLTSTDGHSWTLSPTVSNSHQNSVIEYGGNTIIAGGNGTIIFREE